MRRIALDYTPAIEQRGGIGRYARELTAALAQADSTSNYRLFVAGASLPRLPQPPGDNFEWRPTAVSAKWLARLWHRARVPLPVETFTGPVDLFHATDFVLPPTLARARSLLTVHDLSFLRAPEAASPPLKAYLDAVVPRSVAAADHILADSDATKADLVDLYDTPEERITVLYSGVHRRFQRVEDEHELERIRAKHGLAGIDYILSVGTVQPRKNYSRVIEALARLRGAGYELHYAIAGGHGWLEDEMVRTIHRHGMGDFVHLLGFVEDRDLPALYTGARMLAMASLYEGFGLPILEAMACGAPVIAGNLSSLPEVAGHAALLVDPFDADAIVEAILLLHSDSARRLKLIEAGYEQIRAFSWERAAIQLKSIYDQMLER
ncbi:MAG: glycosyltransferase family 1 protein [Chloroflexi bacterium]|nr:glycosyltransferase family 1 protein [Chloroflexota bacterium]